MSLITLLTDWGNPDFHAAALRGVVVSRCATAMVIDLSHQIPHHSVPSAAFVLSRVWNTFPKGTIHLIAVNSSFEINKGILLYLHEGHFFIAADNGIVPLTVDYPLSKVYKLSTENNEWVYPSFPELFMADCAAKLALGISPDELGVLELNYKQLTPYLPTWEEDEILGKVVYIDSFGNLHSNINYDLFERLYKNRPFRITFVSEKNNITEISKSYTDVKAGDLLALFNQAKMLEIAQRDGHAASLFSVALNTSIRINFNID